MSKKTLYFAFVIGLFAIACNDGNLEVDTISFENSDVLSCTTNDTTATFLFKYSQKQALILNLPANILENKEKTVSGTIPTNFKLYYRTFSDAVTTNYICNAYPPPTPNVTSQIEATGGTVTIVSRPIYNETTGALLRYDHQISITDLVLVNQDGNKIVDSNFVFGTYKTNKQ